MLITFVQILNCFFFHSDATDQFFLFVVFLLCLYLFSIFFFNLIFGSDVCCAITYLDYVCFISATRLSHNQKHRITFTHATDRDRDRARERGKVRKKQHSKMIHFSIVASCQDQNKLIKLFIFFFFSFYRQPCNFEFDCQRNTYWFISYSHNQFSPIQFV